jgi:hypothetical protein
MTGRDVILSEAEGSRDVALGFRGGTPRLRSE